MNKHEQRETLNKWHERQRKQRERQRKKCGLCASNEHDFFSCRLCKNDGHWAQDCPEARKAD